MNRSSPWWYAVIAPCLLSASCAGIREGEFAGAVAAATPEAVEAGVEILEAGGNAVDAAVATALALCVTEPAGSGLGGQSFFLIHPPRGDPVVILGTSRAPRNLPENVSADDLVGHRASTVPSTVRVLEFAWKHHGSGRISWSQLLEPAIRHAEEGFRLGHFRHRSLARFAQRLRASPVTARLFLGPGGAVPARGSIFRQPILARTLRRLASAGAEDFYRGEIAAAMVADMRRNGGWITREDLEELPRPRVVPPLRSTYRGRDVYSLPPPAGGWVVLQALKLLERVPAGDLTARSSMRWVWLAEVLRVCHRNRLASPIRDLDDFETEANRKIEAETADRLWPLLEKPGPAETTHLSVVDGEGLAVGVTQSLNAYFGARAASPELGFLYNDYMAEFELDRPGHPFQLRPGGMPYSSMSATILARDGDVELVLGSPGSTRIISAVVHVVSQWVDGHLPIEEAVAAPRLHVLPDDDLFLEAGQARLSPSLLLELELRGFSIVRPLSSLYRGDRNPYFGGVHAIAREKSGWRGAADPRRDGAVGLAWRRSSVPD